MLVEFAGLPGSGKSTVIRALFAALRGAPFEVIPAHKTARRGQVLSDAMDSPLVNAWPGRALMLQGIRFRRAFPEFVEHVQNAAPDVSEEDEFLASLIGVRYLQARDPSFGDAMVVFDEGFFLRGTAMYTRLGTAGLSDYVALMPPPDALVHVCVPPDLAHARCIARRPEEEGAAASATFVARKFGAPDAFRRRHRVIEHGLAAVDRAGIPVLEMRNTGDLDGGVQTLAETLTSLWKARRVTGGQLGRAAI